MLEKVWKWCSGGSLSSSIGLSRISLKPHQPVYYRYKTCEESVVFLTLYFCFGGNVLQNVRQNRIPTK